MSETSTAFDVDKRVKRNIHVSKNWDKDSQSMESEINSSLRYMRLVRGGDSSVFAWIREEIAIWGRFMYKNKNVPITSLSDIAQT